MPRRYHAYPPEFQVLNVLSSAGASILGVGYLIPMVYLIWSLRYGTARRRRIRGARSASSGRRRRRRRPRISPRRRSSPWDAYDYPVAGGGPRCLRRTRTSHAHHPALAHHFDNLEQQSEAATLGMWVFLVTEVLFFGGLFADLLDLSQLVPGRLRRGEPRAGRLGRHDQHRRAHHQQPDDGAGGARGADRASAGCCDVPGR